MSGVVDGTGVLRRPPRGRGPVDQDLAVGLVGMSEALGDPVRLRPVSTVASPPGGRARACDLLTAFAFSQPTVPHHPGVLRS